MLYILKKEISGYLVIKVENIDMFIFGIKKYFVGVVYLVSDNLLKISNILELLNIIFLYKVKIFGISKILKLF